MYVEHECFKKNCKMLKCNFKINLLSLFIFSVKMAHSLYLHNVRNMCRNTATDATDDKPY